MIKLFTLTLSLLQFIFIASLFISCEKNKAQVNLEGFEYPEGFTVVNLTKESDCSLSPCSTKRVLRLRIKDVVASFAHDEKLSILWQGDGFIHLILCEKFDPEQFEMLKDKDVLISGDLYDACGIGPFRWPTIEYYYFDIKKIEAL